MRMTDFSVKKKRNGAKSIPTWSEWRDGAALCASPLLDDPNASHFGTRLRTKKLKKLPSAAFFTLFALSGFESLPIEKPTPPCRSASVFWSEWRDSNPRHPAPKRTYEGNFR